MDFITFIFVAIGAFHTGWVCREIYAKQKVRELNEELGQNLSILEKQFKDNVIGMRLEKHQDTIYVYDTANNAFICQGKTKTELSEAFYKVNPNKKGIILEGDEFWKEANDK